MDRPAESAWAVAGTVALTLGVGLPTAFGALVAASITGAEWLAWIIAVLVPSLFAWRLLRRHASVVRIAMTAALGVLATFVWAYLMFSGTS